VLPHKAERCENGQYRCPVPGCKHPKGSRVWLAKHFTNDHADYRSWRDLFLNKDAPQFVVRDDEERDAEEPPSERADDDEDESDNERENVNAGNAEDNSDGYNGNNVSNSDNDCDGSFVVVDDEAAQELTPASSAAISSTTNPSWTNRPPVCSTLSQAQNASAFAPVQLQTTPASTFAQHLTSRPNVILQSPAQMVSNISPVLGQHPASTPNVIIQPAPQMAHTLAQNLVPPPASIISPITGQNAIRAPPAAQQQPQVIVMNSNPQQSIQAPPPSPPMSNVPMALVPLSHLAALQNGGQLLAQPPPPPPPPVRYKVVQVAVPKRALNMMLAQQQQQQQQQQRMTPNFVMMPQQAQPEMAIQSPILAAPQPMMMPAASPSPAIFMPMFPVQ